jgi:hypothetical protein
MRKPTTKSRPLHICMNVHDWFSLGWVCICRFFIGIWHASLKSDLALVLAFFRAVSSLVAFTASTGLKTSWKMYGLIPPASRLMEDVLQPHCCRRNEIISLLTLYDALVPSLSISQLYFWGSKAVCPTRSCQAAAKVSVPRASAFTIFRQQHLLYYNHRVSAVHWHQLSLLVRHGYLLALQVQGCLLDPRPQLRSRKTVQFLSMWVSRHANLWPYSIVPGFIRPFLAASSLYKELR